MADDYSREASLKAFAEEQRKLGVPEEQIQASVRELSSVPPAPARAGGATAEAVYVSGWPRLGSAIIDGIVIYVIKGIVGLFSYSLTYYLYRYFMYFDLFIVRWFAYTVGLLGIPGILYLTLMVGWKGQTLGKMMLGQKVVRDDLGKVGYGRALLRYTVGYFVAGIVFGIGFIAIFFNKRRQGWHDRIAQTVVIRSR